MPSHMIVDVDTYEEFALFSMTGRLPREKNETKGLKENEVSPEDQGLAYQGTTNSSQEAPGQVHIVGINGFVETRVSELETQDKLEGQQRGNQEDRKLGRPLNAKAHIELNFREVK